MTPEQLDAIQARANAATEGPWKSSDFDHQGFYTVGDAASYQEILDAGECEESNPTAHVYIEPDAEFIAHARTDVPALLAYARDLEARLEAGRARVGELISEQMYGELHYEDIEELRAALTATEGQA